MSSDHLQFNQISKSFPGVQALDRVSFSVDQGAVHALLGENGAGKSTILKILSGVHLPSEGSVELEGRARQFRSTQEAIDAGIAVIYQELQLVPEMSVAENVFLGHLPNRKGWVDSRALQSETAKVLAELGENIDPGAKVGTLSIGQRQMVEIAKALARNAKVIAFDEPTSSLSSREVSKLFQVIRELQQKGRVVLYVTHRLEEVFEICTSATILRDGRHIATLPSIKEATRDQIVSLMVGRDLHDIYGFRERKRGETVLSVAGLKGSRLSAPATFAVKKGEIVGFFGLVGSGRSELMRLVYGADHSTGGQVTVDGQTLKSQQLRQSIRSGLVFCPEDRKKEGIIPQRSVSDNINISSRRRTAKLGVFVDAKKEKETAEEYVEKLNIRTPSISQLLVNLSGGNQQKVILARWLCENIKAIILDEPTRGIDVGAKREIYDLIYTLAESGIGVVVVSSELPEVLGICDRVIVMSEGRITAELTRAEADQEKVMRHALPASGSERAEEATK